MGKNIFRKAVISNDQWGIFLILIGLMVPGPSFAQHQNVSAPKSPNVLVILSDDQGWGDYGFNGNTVVHTPVLDSLAASSVRFDRFYVSPLCAPTRASLLTGRYNQATGATWVTQRREVMRQEEVTIAERFKAHGYRTGLFGKWHNGKQYPHDPTGQGFDRFVGFSEGHLNNYFNARLVDGREEKMFRGYVPDVLADEAIRFIQQRGPFLCWVSFNTPHSPFQVPDAYFDKYKKQGLDDKLACIYAMVENMDWNIGRLLKALKTSGKERETVVVFLSDNGPNSVRYNGIHKNIKGSVDEGGVRTAFLIRYPGGGMVGKRVDKMGVHLDLFPTLAELAHIPTTGNPALHGRSLVPLLKDPNAPWPERYFYTQQSGRKLEPSPGAIRNDRYLLTFKGQDTLLYDWANDPAQLKDKSSEEPQRVKEMGVMYKAWWESTAASGMEPQPIEVGHPKVRQIEFPAQEGVRYGQVSYFGKQGWANDWLVGFQDVSDSVVWTLKSVGTQQYQVVVRMAVPGPVSLRIGLGKARLRLDVAKPLVAPQVPSPDRVERQEVYERSWAEVKAGKVTLGPGLHQLTCYPLTPAPGLEIKGIYLRKL